MHTTTNPDTATWLRFDPCGREMPKVIGYEYLSCTVRYMISKSRVADPDPGSGNFLTPGSGIGDPE
jgi:hypothetical protein